MHCLAPLTGGGGVACVVQPELPVAGGGGTGLGTAVVWNQADAPAAFELKKAPGQAKADEQNESANHGTADPWGAGGEALSAVKKLIEPAVELLCQRFAGGRLGEAAEIRPGEDLAHFLALPGVGGQLCGLCAGLGKVMGQARLGVLEKLGGGGRRRQSFVARGVVFIG